MTQNNIFHFIKKFKKKKTEAPGVTLSFPMNDLASPTIPSSLTGVHLKETNFPTASFVTQYCSKPVASESGVPSSSSVCQTIYTSEVAKEQEMPAQHSGNQYIYYGYVSLEKHHTQSVIIFNYQ